LFSTFNYFDTSVYCEISLTCAVLTGDLDVLKFLVLGRVCYSLGFCVSELMGAKSSPFKLHRAITQNITD